MFSSTACTTPHRSHRSPSALPAAIGCCFALAAGAPLRAEAPGEQSGEVVGEPGPTLQVLKARQQSSAHSGGAPKEIVLEPGAPVEKLDPLQQQALDNAFLAGATEVGAPTRVTTRDHDLQRDIGVQGGRCYYVSVAYTVGFRMHVYFAMGPGLDERPISEGLAKGDVVIGPGKGVAHFCIDRPGSVSLHLGLDGNSQDMHGPIEYAMAFGWRPETAAQVDARRRAVARGEKNPG